MKKSSAIAGVLLVAMQALQGCASEGGADEPRGAALGGGAGAAGTAGSDGTGASNTGGSGGSDGGSAGAGGGAGSDGGSAGAGGGAGSDGGSAGAGGGAGASGVASKNWSPGHYLYADKEDDKGSFVGLDPNKAALVSNNANFAGYHFRVDWKILEPNKEQWNMAPITQAITHVNSLPTSKKVIVQLVERDNTGKICPLPADLCADEDNWYYTSDMNDAGVAKIMPKLWKPEVYNRFIGLIDELGSQFNDNGAIAYIALDEFNFPEARQRYMTENAATAAQFSSAMTVTFLAIHDALSAAFPNTVFIQMGGWNGGVSEQKVFDDIIPNLVAGGGGFGEPDAVEALRPFSATCSTRKFGSLQDSGKAYWGANYEPDGSAWGPLYRTYALAPSNDDPRPLTASFQIRTGAPIMTSSQLPSLKANSAQKVLEYVQHVAHSNFHSWSPASGGSHDLCWTVDDAIAAVNAAAQSGLTINEEVPKNITAK